MTTTIQFMQQMHWDLDLLHKTHERSIMSCLNWDIHLPVRTYVEYETTLMLKMNNPQALVDQNINPKISGV